MRRTSVSFQKNSNGLNVHIVKEGEDVKKKKKKSQDIVGEIFPDLTKTINSTLIKLNEL